MAVKFNDGEYKLLNGNQIGIILLYYLTNNKDLKNNYFIDTIVSSRLTRKIALANKMNVITTYTGFKFISQQVEHLILNNKKFAFAYEESYGYLLKDIIRDKDAFQPLVLLTEIACFYKNKGINLINVLDDIYNKYGYFKEELLSFTFSGVDGQTKMNNLIYKLKNDDIKFETYLISSKKDYSLNDLIINNINLYKSDIIEYNFKEDIYAIFRPSGTEPKFKVYIGAKGENLDDVYSKINSLKKEVLKLFDK